MKIRYSSAAHDDLVKIIQYGTQNFGEAQALKHVAKLEEAVRLIGHFPELARLRTELKWPARVHTVWPHMIVYNLESGMIVILRILTSGQNLETEGN